MTIAEATPATGLGASLQRLASTLVTTLETRLDLLSTEFAEDRARVLSLVLLALTGLFCVGLAAVLGSMLVVLLCGAEYRVLALAVMTGSYLAIGVACGACALRKAHRAPKLFTTSLAVLAVDRRRLQAP